MICLATDEMQLREYSEEIAFSVWLIFRSGREECKAYTRHLTLVIFASVIYTDLITAESVVVNIVAQFWGQSEQQRIETAAHRAFDNQYFCKPILREDLHCITRRDRCGNRCLIWGHLTHHICSPTALARLSCKQCKKRMRGS